jgi:hypothetical protein
MKNLHLYNKVEFQNSKPVLRPLQDIRKEEFLEICELFYPNGHNFSNQEIEAGFQAMKTHGGEALDFSELKYTEVAKFIAFYLSNGFDLGLLEPGTYILK